MQMLMIPKLGSLVQDVAEHVIIFGNKVGTVKAVMNLYLTFLLPFALPSLELTFNIRAPEEDGRINGINVSIIRLVPK